jgi:hypothetical protein
MPAQSTYTPIATFSSASNITFSFTSIPQIYTDLVLAGNLRGVNGGSVEYILCKVNALSATQSFTALESNGSTTTSVRNSPSITGGWNYLGLMPGGTSTAGVFGSLYAHINNYTNTNTNKTILSRLAADQNGSGVTQLFANLATTTSAITSLTIQGSNGTVGTLTLYGIAAA